MKEYGHTMRTRKETRRTEKGQFKMGREFPFGVRTELVF